MKYFLQNKKKKVFKHSLNIKKKLSNKRKKNFSLMMLAPHNTSTFLIENDSSPFFPDNSDIDDFEIKEDKNEKKNYSKICDYDFSDLRAIIGAQADILFSGKNSKKDEDDIKNKSRETSASTEA